jgi:hypothetical protein
MEGAKMIEQQLFTQNQLALQQAKAITYGGFGIFQRMP